MPPTLTPPPILFLHGFTGRGDLLGDLAAAFPNRRRLAPDLIGHGQSSSPAEVEHYRMDACIDQLLAALDALGVPRCDVFGYSMGARVGLSLACAEPSRVRNLALVGGTPGLAAAAERRARVEADATLATSIESEGIEAFVDRWMAQPLFASQVRLGAEALRTQRKLRLDNDPVGLANSLRGMGTGSMPALHEELPVLGIPTWWIHGSEDPKFAAIAAEAAALMPNAQVVTVADAGHAAHLENREAVAARLRVAFNPPRFPV